MENDFYMRIRICLIANVVPYWNLLNCIWCYLIIQWNKWVKYYCICVYEIPLNSCKSTWAKGSSTIVIMCCLSSVRDYFKHYWLFRNCWTEFNEIWQEFKQSSTKFVFLGWFENQERCPGLWLAKTFLTSLKLLNRIQRNLTESKLSKSTTKFVFWGHWKPRWPPWPLIGRDLFLLLLCNDWTEFNETWQEQDLNVFYQFRVFGADGKTKMATLASDSLRHLNLQQLQLHLVRMLV